MLLLFHGSSYVNAPPCRRDGFESGYLTPHQGGAPANGAEPERPPPWRFSSSAPSWLQDTALVGSSLDDRDNAKRYEGAAREITTDSQCSVTLAPAGHDRTPSRRGMLDANEVNAKDEVGRNPNA